MKRILVVLFAAAVSLLPGWKARADNQTGPLRVCILSGCPTYNSEQSLPPFQKWLEETYNVHCTRAVRRAVDDLPGLEQLDDCDAALVFFKRMELKASSSNASRNTSAAAVRLSRCAPPAMRFKRGSISTTKYWAATTRCTTTKGR